MAKSWRPSYFKNSPILHTVKHNLTAIQGGLKHFWGQIMGLCFIKNSIFIYILDIFIILQLW